MTTTDRDDRLLTTREVADLLGITVDGLHGWRYRGESSPPALKIGGRLRFRRSAVEQWIDEQAEHPEPAEEPRVSGRPVGGGR